MIVIFLSLLVSPFIFIFLKRKIIGYVNLSVVIIYIVSWFNVLKYKASGIGVNFEIAIWIGSLYLSIGFLLLSVALLYIKITRTRKYYILLFNICLSVAVSLFFEYMDEGFMDFNLTEFVLGIFLLTYLITFFIVCLVHLNINNNKQVR